VYLTNIFELRSPSRRRSDTRKKSDVSGQICRLAERLCDLLLNCIIPLCQHIVTLQFDLLDAELETERLLIAQKELSADQYTHEMARVITRLNSKRIAIVTDLLYWKVTLGDCYRYRALYGSVVVASGDAGSKNTTPRGSSSSKSPSSAVSPSENKLVSQSIQMYQSAISDIARCSEGNELDVAVNSERLRAIVNYSVALYELQGDIDSTKQVCLIFSL